MRIDHRRAGNILMLAGLATVLVAAIAPAAFGDDEGEVEGYTVSGSRSFDGSSTTFTFELGGRDPQQVELVSCPEGIPYASASGPNGEQPQPGEGNIKHDGARFPNSGRGTYTITYASEVSGAQIVVSPAGNRHRHYNVGTGCSGGTPASTSSSSSSTSSTSTTSTSSSTTTTTELEEPTTTSSSTTTTEGTGGAGGPESTTSTSSTTTTTESDDPDVAGAVETTTSTSEPGGEVAGETGGQGVAADADTMDPDTTDPEVGGVAAENLPRTGRGLSQSLLLAGLALLLGGVTIRFGEPEERPRDRSAA